eukprot:scaffold10062_cov99-Isochrysis_galbana.AAC.4
MITLLLKREGPSASRALLGRFLAIFQEFANACDGAPRRGWRDASMQRCQRGEPPLQRQGRTEGRPPAGKAPKIVPAARWSIAPTAPGPSPRAGRRCCLPAAAWLRAR